MEGGVLVRGRDKEGDGKRKGKRERGGEGWGLYDKGKGCMVIRDIGTKKLFRIKYIIRPSQLCAQNWIVFRYTSSPAHLSFD